METSRPFQDSVCCEGSLPESWGHIPNLQELNLTANTISGRAVNGVKGLEMIAFHSDTLIDSDWTLRPCSLWDCKTASLQ